VPGSGARRPRSACSTPAGRVPGYGRAYTQDKSRLRACRHPVLLARPRSGAAQQALCHTYPILHAVGPRHIHPWLRPTSNTAAPEPAAARLGVAQRPQEHLVQAQAVRAVRGHHVVRVDHVAAALAHLVRARGHAHARLRAQHEATARLLHLRLRHPAPARALSGVGSFETMSRICHGRIMSLSRCARAAEQARRSATADTSFCAQHLDWSAHRHS
jgi:hypothetical protein